MNEMTRLPAEPLPCPVCNIGQTTLYEELQPASPVSDPGVVIELRLQLRICDHCKVELAGAEETRFNKERVSAARALHGALAFRRSSEAYG